MLHATNGTTRTLDIDALIEGLGPVDPTRRQVGEADWRRFEGYASEILTAFGLDLATPGTVDTPRRFLRALYDATDGYDGDPKLLTAFPTECHGDANCQLAQVVEGPIPFTGLCEHHVLPFAGRAWVAYVAHDQIIGISKLTRLVRVLTRRFGVQERMTHEIADSLEAMLGAHGTAVVLEAQHRCTQMRGVREHEPRTRTTAYRGTYVGDPALAPSSARSPASGWRAGDRLSAAAAPADAAVSGAATAGLPPAWPIESCGRRQVGSAVRGGAAASSRRGRRRSCSRCGRPATIGAIFVSTPDASRSTGAAPPAVARSAAPSSPDGS